jgi:hypothetical protein
VVRDGQGFGAEEEGDNMYSDESMPDGSGGQEDPEATPSRGSLQRTPNPETDEDTLHHRVVFRQKNNGSQRQGLDSQLKQGHDSQEESRDSTQAWVCSSREEQSHGSRSAAEYGPQTQPEHDSQM